MRVQPPLYIRRANAVWQAIQVDLCEGQPFMMACLISQDRLPELSCVIEFFEDHKASTLYLGQDLQTLVDAFKTDSVSEAPKPQVPVRPAVIAANEAYAKEGQRKRKRRKGPRTTHTLKGWHKRNGPNGSFVMRWNTISDGKERRYRPDDDTQAFVWRNGKLVPALI